jgi:hypothetical protein
MYRLCLTSGVLFLLGAGAGHAQESPVAAAAAATKSESTAPTRVESAPSVDDYYALAGIGEVQVPARRLERPVAARTAAQTIPAKTVPIQDLGQRTVCEQIKLPGSRIVVENRCSTSNVNDRSEAKLAAQRKEYTQLQIETLRREQDNMERMQREREMARERAIAAMALQGH